MQRADQPSVKPLDTRPINQLSLRLGEHWAIVGVTGSGKTHFAKELLEYLRRQYPHAKRYVLDSTEDGFEGLVGALYVRGNRVPDPLRDASYTQVWVPDTDDSERYNQYFEQILYAREEAIVLVDEIASLGTHPPEGVIKLLKQGRKHGITVVSLTQEIAKVTPTIFRQMKHFVLFRINREIYDMSMARRYLQVLPEQQRQPAAKYGFFYRRTDGDFLSHEYMNAQSFFRKSV